MKFETLATGIFSAGISMLAFHQLVQYLLLKHVNDGLARYNVLDDLIEVLILSILFITVPIILILFRAGYRHYKK